MCELIRNPLGYLDMGVQPFWQKTTAILVGWFAGCRCKKITKCGICNFLIIV